MSIRIEIIRSMFLIYELIPPLYWYRYWNENATKNSLDISAAITNNIILHWPIKINLSQTDCDVQISNKIYSF